jgi:hypothetical protein
VEEPAEALDVSVKVEHVEEKKAEVLVKAPSQKTTVIEEKPQA